MEDEAGPLVRLTSAGLAATLAEEVYRGARGRPVALSAQDCAALGAALARAGVRPACAADALRPLPLEVVVDILARLPVDQRLLAALVNRSWHRATAETNVWRLVNLGRGSGVAERLASDALLRAISVKAAGGLVVLELGERICENEPPVMGAVLREVVAANSRSLRRLSVVCPPGAFRSRSFIAALLRAAPHLDVLCADLSCTSAKAHQVLTGKAPYGPLRVRRLNVKEPWDGQASVVAVARGVEAHPSLEWLQMERTPLATAASLAAVLGAAMRLPVLILRRCSLSPASVPQLARLLRDGRLRTFEVIDNGGALLDEATAPDFCAAVKACRLKALRLHDVRLWGDPAIGQSVVAALVSHPTIVTLGLNSSSAGADSQAGGSLAVLVAANMLAELNLSFCRLGDAGLRPILAALRGASCTRLRSLVIRSNGATQAFARNELLPAVTANASLRELKADGVPSVPELAQAEALVAARPPVAAS